VHVTSRRGSEIFPVKISEDIANSQAFIAMHWGSEFISGSASKNPGRGVNGLTNHQIDPISGQPELKHAAIKILRANLPWQLVAFGLFPKDEAFSIQNSLRKLLPQFGSAYCVLFGREQDSNQIGVSFKAAHDEDPMNDPDSSASKAIKEVMRLFKLDESSIDPVLRYSDNRRGVVRLVRAKEKVLSAMLTGSIDSLASTVWLRQYVEQGFDAKLLGRSLLVPFSKPPLELQATSKAICNCFNVKEGTINDLLSACHPPLASVEEGMAMLQDKTQCGTNCGSCKPEVKQLVLKHFQVQPVA
jgi:assimilatory nitrate reductase catalytic subunit